MPWTSPTQGDAAYSPSRTWPEHGEGLAVATISRCALLVVAIPPPFSSYLIIAMSEQASRPASSTPSSSPPPRFLIPRLCSPPHLTVTVRRIPTCPMRHSPSPVRGVERQARTAKATKSRKCQAGTR
ncbi:unnamed protein product [Diplocarpon coronariae]